MLGVIILLLESLKVVPLAYLRSPPTSCWSGYGISQPLGKFLLEEYITFESPRTIILSSRVMIIIFHIEGQYTAFGEKSILKV